MRILSIVHERAAGSGVFADVAAQRGDEVTQWIPTEQPIASSDGFDAVLVFGGAMHVDQEREHPWLTAEKELLDRLLAAGTPALGLCLGAQLLAEAAGGGARRAAAPEIGWAAAQLTEDGARDQLLGALPAQFESFQWHSYELCAPPGAAVLAHSASCLQAFRAHTGPCWGIQFHAEVTEQTVAAWVADYRSDADAVRAKLDWRALLAQTRREIERWNALGRGLCERFLEHAETVRS